jgi:anti-sigma factor RsiW
MMSDMHTRWTDQLSDYLDGSLGSEERQALEEHLNGCPTCTAALTEIEDVVRRAHALGEVTPRRDLWPGISSALDELRGEAGAEVIPLRSGPPRPAVATAGLYLSRRQLAAAAAVVALVSAAVTWALGPGLAVQRSGTPLPPASAVTQVSRVEAPPAPLADELAHLEAALTAARQHLDPATVRILEKNLEVIDRAIQDSRRALATDPANPFLREHLQNAYRQKLDYLREATSIAGWSG